MKKPCSKCGGLFIPKTSQKTCALCIPTYLTCPKCGKVKAAGSVLCMDCDIECRSGRSKEAGVGLWMKGRTIPASVSAKAAQRGKVTRTLLKDTSAVQVQNFMRKMTNRKTGAAKPIREGVRDKHNSDWRYKEWRKAVFERDDLTCGVCGTRGGALHAHHVKAWAKYPDLRYEVANGVTVCEEPCHKELHRKVTGIPKLLNLFS